MRTKELLVTAAASVAGILAAQAQVYSINVVGFVNKTLEPGYNMIANPLNGSGMTNTLAAIIPNPPEGMVVTLWNGETQTVGTSATYFLGSWDSDPNAINIPPGEGLLVQVAERVTLTFVGEVPQGTLTNVIGGNYQLKASIVPQAGTLVGELGFNVQEGDVISLWSPLDQRYGTVTTYFLGSWDNGEPSLGVGEAFYVQRDPLVAKPENDWVRTFNVQ